MHSIYPSCHALLTLSSFIGFPRDFEVPRLGATGSRHIHPFMNVHEALTFGLTYNEADIDWDNEDKDDKDKDKDKDKGDRTRYVSTSFIPSICLLPQLYA